MKVINSDYFTLPALRLFNLLILFCIAGGANFTVTTGNTENKNASKETDVHQPYGKSKKKSFLSPSILHFFIIIIICSI